MEPRCLVQERSNDRGSVDVYYDMKKTINYVVALFGFNPITTALNEALMIGPNLYLIKDL